MVLDEIDDEIVDALVFEEQCLRQFPEAFLHGADQVDHDDGIEPVLVESL